ncbi:translation initiation factor eIF-2B subunit delta-like isoform X2 [Tigriopus californicus]|uniref:translation initiation factor eIF-2B subunit delta-like isoform X2 n=1 Tax=Tigriopus californicus TaxID=6832 RepID=UPI0027D9D109|nr:translation initiation factor eIF-2B subunit delta-like isoform X2 [Tigriopus californicus]XP_059088142.1 translation initiation factor eIF-2B subunit delta-like isoform X2 [Tigriopus californicus]
MAKKKKAAQGKGQPLSTDSTEAEKSKTVVKVEPDSNSVQSESRIESPLEKEPIMSDKKVEKTKEEILAEREAKKAAKAAKKSGVKPSDSQAKRPATPPKNEDKSKAQILAQREAQKAAKVNKQIPAKADSPQDSKISANSGTLELAVAQETKPVDGGKTKAELKAERRAKQEAQRAAKLAGAKPEGADSSKKGVASRGNKPQIQSQPSITKSKVQRVPDDMQADRQSVEKKVQKKLQSAQIPARVKAQRKVVLFSHLHQYERELSMTREIPVVGGVIHSAILELGLRYSEGIITGSNARCVALMNAMSKVIRDYSTPPHKDLPRDLDSRIKPYITFLRQCRPLSLSMGNAIRFLKTKINALDPSLPEDEAKEQLLDSIDNYVHENIVLAAKQISITAREKIRNGDVIMIYGCSSLLRTVLIDAVQESKLKIRVIVVDGRPKYEGREMVRHLVNAGINCTYVQITSVPYMMPEVTKVLLGAYAVLANGSVMSRVGTSQVALVAKGFNVPVLVCCETYKFSERVQTDSFVFNELGDPDDLVDTGRPSFTPLEDWRDLNSLTLLNLTYDVTPPTLVDAIISEVSVIPTTSVPVILRLKNIDHVAT